MKEVVLKEICSTIVAGVVLLAIMFGIATCSKGAHDDIHKIQAFGVDIEKSKFQDEGHSYIAWRGSSISVIHDPDCHCLRSGGTAEKERGPR